VSPTVRRLRADEHALLRDLRLRAEGALADAVALPPAPPAVRGQLLTEGSGPEAARPLPVVLGTGGATPKNGR
jgi:hypothetical protein